MRVWRDYKSKNPTFAKEYDKRVKELAAERKKDKSKVRKVSA